MWERSSKSACLVCLSSTSAVVAASPSGVYIHPTLATEFRGDPSKSILNAYGPLGLWEDMREPLLARDTVS